MLFETLGLRGFLLICLPGVGFGWAMRWLLHRAWLKREGEVESRYDGFIYLMGTLTQSVAVGVALTIVGAVLAAQQVRDARVLGGLVFVTAVVTGFLAAFLRELIRRLFYTQL